MEVLAALNYCLHKIKNEKPSSGNFNWKLKEDNGGSKRTMFKTQWWHYFP